MKNILPQVSFAPCSCHTHVPDLTRRRLLSRAIGLGIGTFGAMTGCTSILTPSTPANAGLVDVHHHLIPPFYLAEYRDKIATSRGGQITPAWLGWSPDKAIQAMEAANVATAVLSLSSPGVWFGDSAAASRTARRVNEYAAELVNAHKGRFGFFAAVPLPDQEASLREVEYAFDVLRADGIGLLTSYGDKWVGNPAYEPVFAELNRRKAVVFVHPTAPSCCRSLLPDIPTVIAEVPQDTARAITNLLVTGTFSRFQDIKFIFTHAGGNMPMILGRIKQYGPANLKSLAPNGLEHELAKHYYDLAGTANRPAVSAITSIVPTSQILLGSDNPYIPLGETVGDLKDLSFSAADLRRIQRENALSLIPSLASR